MDVNDVTGYRPAAERTYVQAVRVVARVVIAAAAAASTIGGGGGEKSRDRRVARDDWPVYDVISARRPMDGDDTKYAETTAPPAQPLRDDARDHVRHSRTLSARTPCPYLVARHSFRRSHIECRARCRQHPFSRRRPFVLQNHIHIQNNSLLCPRPVSVRCRHSRRRPLTDLRRRHSRMHIW